MFRKPNTNRTGGSFNTMEILAVWEKGRTIPGYSPAEWRADICGNPIRFQEYGNTSSTYGWEIDHIIPVSKNGSDLLYNLQPLQWENNRQKADNYPWFCAA